MGARVRVASLERRYGSTNAVVTHMNTLNAARTSCIFPFVCYFCVVEGQTAPASIGPLLKVHKIDEGFFRCRQEVRFL